MELWCKNTYLKNKIDSDDDGIEIDDKKNIRDGFYNKDEIDEILVVDNGDGMNESTFNKALQMSSGTRGNAKKLVKHTRKRP